MDGTRGVITGLISTRKIRRNEKVSVFLRRFILGDVALNEIDRILDTVSLADAYVALEGHYFLYNNGNKKIKGERIYVNFLESTYG